MIELVDIEVKLVLNLIGLANFDESEKLIAQFDVVADMGDQLV